MKRRIFIEIKNPKSDVLFFAKKRLNLDSRSTVVIPLKLSLKIIFICILFLSFVFGSASAPTLKGVVSAQTSDEERKALESQLAELESQISQYETTVEEYKKQGSTLQAEIKRLETQISKLNLQIKAVNLSLAKLDSEISSTQSQIVEIESGIELNKKNLSQTLQTLYENDDTNLVEVLFKNPKLSDFFTDLNNLLTVQENLRVLIQEITEARGKLIDQKEALALERADAIALKSYQDSQKATIQKTQSEKNTLLKETKGKESEYQKILAETKSKAAEIRNRIFRLLGGGELPFGEAVKLAQVSEKATGVRAAFILAVLTQESAIDGVIGKNLGRCYYNTYWANSSRTVMSNSQKPTFLRILAELGLNPDTTPVSCPIISDGSYGGAMGPAQFMPTTWDLYDEKVADITGGNPASPFNNLDAFTATALLLKDGLNACSQIYSTNFSRENCAAAKYYAGGNWRLYTRVGRYGYRVAERASGFQKDIDFLTST